MGRLSLFRICPEGVHSYLRNPWDHDGRPMMIFGKRLQVLGLQQLPGDPNEVKTIHLYGHGYLYVRNVTTETAYEIQ